MQSDDVYGDTKSRITGGALEAITDVFHRMPWGQDVALSNGIKGTIRPVTKAPKIVSRPDHLDGKPYFIFDVSWATGHLEFLVYQSGWGGTPLGGEVDES